MVGEDEDFSFCLKTLLDRLIEGKGVYCGVCMRGGEEITLMRPRRVKELIQYHGFRIFEPIDSRMPWACVVCESAAAHALRAHRALRCAARVTALLTELRAADTRGGSKNVGTEARRVLWKECEAMLRSVRGARKLVRTDVLVVDSTGVRADNDPMGHKRTAIKTPSRLQTNSPASSEIETVILDDDEDPLAMTPGPPNTGPPNTGPPNTGRLVQLTPLVSIYNASNVLYVPQQNNNQNVIVLIDNDCTVQKDEIAELMLKGTDDGARKRARLGGSGGAGPPGVGGSPGGHYVVDIDDVTGMIKEHTRLKLESKDESRSSVPSRPVGKSRGTGRGTERGIEWEAGRGTERGIDWEAGRGTERGIEWEAGRGTERGIVREAEIGTEREAGRAVPNGARVDWEDKIPMDVISFMDATDPHAGDLIVQERSLARGGRWDPPFIDLN